MVVMAKPGTRIRSYSHARAGQQCRAAGTRTKIISLISISLVSAMFLLLQPKAAPKGTRPSPISQGMTGYDEYAHDSRFNLKVTMGQYEQKSPSLS